MLYPDIVGALHVFDNTHSNHVRGGDSFIYLDKTTDYAFSAIGDIKRVRKRKPTHEESDRIRGVTTVYEAELADVTWFRKPLSISPRHKIGRVNRTRLGIVDVNLLGWSKSISRIYPSMLESILRIAETDGLFPESEIKEGTFSVSDSWTTVRSRPRMAAFRNAVFRRSNSACVVCGSAAEGLVEAAHLSPFATDERNRANPANGVCMCVYCHRALDLRHIAITPSGQVLFDQSVMDDVARLHFTRLEPVARQSFLRGVDPTFLELTVTLHRALFGNGGSSKDTSSGA
jgi:hypothetical protein